ncbi:PREDICTED: ferric-chelate reductase 1-like isoform X6 [Acropora digitifera]|uniref:ferric-chelate reductase 1-like isoform X6 n=2 Tax=Acropora digitifera TaxID=70779 RepID=UPI00077A78A9|nr:PREDICTED: ferric-chelate reductase 1-like isoform X6 [Acropora digitifera]XP_015762639.1 PREDICTED: ferric-chelate reductase 1-like isoform X6 [Acropora digitifera]XP_015762640.1 PREDICTED: ferric-chelate reductase 1-like isoform X6 [Acropora digitifera]
MRDTDILMCVSDASLDGHYYANSRQTPQRTRTTPSAVSILLRAFENNRMKCRVSRVINPGLTNFKDLNRSLFLLAAYGPLGGGGGIRYHTLRRSSSERLRLPEAGQANDDVSRAAPGLTHAGGGISQHHTFQQSSTERVRLPEASQANDNVFTTAPGPIHVGGGISQHTLRRSSKERVRVLETRQVKNDESIDAKVLAHGILMTLAWTLFAFVGLFTARYMRQVWQPTKIWGKDAWFTVHRVLMTTTVLLTVTGTIVIFVKVKGWSSGAGAHPICGMIAIILAVIQPIMAALRPSPNAPKRGIFNWSHRIVGSVALVMAVVSIYLGLDQVGLGKQGLYAVIAFYIGEFLVFVFEFYLILSKRNKEKRTVTGDIPMQSSGVETQQQQQPDMSPQEAMIRTMMFVVVILVGFSVSLTIIILLVSKE